MPRVSQTNQQTESCHCLFSIPVFIINSILLYNDSFPIEFDRFQIDHLTIIISVYQIEKVKIALEVN